MHNAEVVVRNLVVVDLAGASLLEVELLIRTHVLQTNADVIVAVRSHLLVMEAHCVTKLVHDQMFL